MEKVTISNFIDVIDKTNGLHILEVWLGLPNPNNATYSFYLHIRQTFEANTTRIAEKPWNYPEIWVPLLNLIHFTGMNTWEVRDGDDSFLACEMCVYEHLTENIGVYNDVVMGENYIDEEAKIFATEDVFGEHVMSDKTCAGCGVILL
jgi:hypothetical protein